MAAPQGNKNASKGGESKLIRIYLQRYQWKEIQRFLPTPSDKGAALYQAALGKLSPTPEQIQNEISRLEQELDDSANE